MTPVLLNTEQRYRSVVPDISLVTFLVNGANHVGLPYLRQAGGIDALVKQGCNWGFN